MSESHGYWLNLMKGKTNPGKIALNQTSQKTYCRSYIPAGNTTQAFDIPAKSNILPAEAMPEEYSQWFYLDKNFELIKF